ncbi:MAG: carbamoyltransferase [Burkholderiales bacterium]|nr:MAG: carbamoyltransferase [Burkholderiales bacterium]
MAVIIGVNAYHSDSAACLLVDGRLVAAAEEERFRRVKHWAGFPVEAIRYCLQSAGLRLADVDFVALNQDAKANIGRKLGFMLTKRPDLSMVLDRIKNKRERTGALDELLCAFPEDKFKGSLRPIEHHMAHLASAFCVSPFEQATVLSVDGFGDFASAAWGQGHGNSVEVEDKVYFPHSLGIFYMALTQYLGFPNWGDEYKIMGLAPYGEPRFLNEMRKIVLLQSDGTYKLDLDYFRHHKEKTEDEWDSGEPRVAALYTPKLESLLGPRRDGSAPLEQRHRDMARSVQAMYEEAFFHLLNRLHERHEMDHLALAGGCAMNSVANGKIYKHTPYKKVYIQSAAGDAGGAIGAAYAIESQINPGHVRFQMTHAYFGPEFSDQEIAQLIEEKRKDLIAAGCTIMHHTDEQALLNETAYAIAQGQVIGWFHGRMEWGPRALGNRSILGDPRRADMKDILNIKIKRRESFRPFAPSILRESVSQWFETDDDVPFMMQVYQIRENKRKLIPAVTHVDGSGRLQTVHQTTNPRYYGLIEAFRRLTDIPIVLNTSFNENEPVVCRPAEALDCFLRTKMDVLALGNWLIRRQS